MHCQPVYILTTLATRLFDNLGAGI